MDKDTATWLAGQVDAIRRLADSVGRTVQLHCVEAAKDLNQIQFACNRANMTLNAAITPQKDKVKQ